MTGFGTPLPDHDVSCLVAAISGVVSIEIYTRNSVFAMSLTSSQALEIGGRLIHAGHESLRNDLA